MSIRFPTLIAASLFATLAQAVEPAAPAATQPAPAAAQAPAPAPVYLEILDEHDAKRASVAKSRATGEEQLQTQARIVGAIDTMRHFGLITANALLMLFGSVLVGALIAVGVTVIKRVQRRNAA